MAKELPYYKHEPSEWLEGEIQVCSDAAIVCFTNLRDGYWLKLGCMSYAFAMQKYCRRDASIIQELIDAGIIDLEGENIRIKFLDIQLHEFYSVSEKRTKAANARWKNANEMQLHSKSNAIRVDKIKEEKKKEKNNTNQLSLISVRKDSFKETLIPFFDLYGKELMNEFFAYWTEQNKSNTKMKFELQQTWSVERRLATWAKNDKNFNNKNNGNTEKPTREDIQRKYISDVLSRNQQ